MLLDLDSRSEVKYPVREKYSSEILFICLLIQEIVQQLREYTTLIMHCKVDKKVLTATPSNLAVSVKSCFFFPFLNVQREHSPHVLRIYCYRSQSCKTVSARAAQ